MSNTQKPAAAKNAAASKKNVKKTTAPKAAKTTKPTSDASKRASEIAEQHGVETVFENHLGEYFTVENLAMLSVKGDKKLLTIHRPALIKATAPLPPAEDEVGEDESGADEDGGTGDGGADPGAGEGGKE